MHQGPRSKRYIVAFIVALGLLAAFGSPTLAQDNATPSAGDENAGPQGTLTVLYYLCDGRDAGLSFDVGNPNEGNPNPPVDECSIAGTTADTTFLVYLGGGL